ncbi:MAG: fibronectin type III domain-containing protein, partial [Candidatus Yanofskybacteria bacterium]|nr:fibronectin type III domain-containing protein [Candidatus Yanofskybacteria bacterium]
MQFAYDDSANLATPIEAINIGQTITANTWTYVVINLGATTRTSITSFGFVINQATALDNNTVRIDNILIGPGLPTFPGGGIIKTRFLSFPTSTTASVTYGAGGGTSGVTAPSTGGVYTFTTQSRASDSGTLTNIGASPTVTINNPLPVLSNISPESKIAGSAEFTLTVNGSNYVSNSVVEFVGSGRTTVFINSTQLTATILASDIVVDGTFSITVTNPAPGGGTSNGSPFTVAPTPPPPDTTPPSAITNLTLSEATTSSIKLTWTAPGDDGDVGAATSYDIRYSTALITESSWGTATQITGEPSPSAAGGSQNITITGLSNGTTYFFAIKASDGIPNTSGLSNVPSLATIS